MLTPSQADEVVKICARIEASAASIKVLAAARSAESDLWQAGGFRSPADQLARQTGMSPGGARKALETGRRMAEQPEVAEAALAGELSLEQAEAVSDGVAADPTRARELIDKAKQASMPELNEEIAKIKAARTDAEQLRRQRHARRSLRNWTDRDGAMQGHIYGQPEDRAGLMRMIDPVRRRLIVLRRAAGGPVESLEALDYDALMAVASIAAGHDGELGLADLLELGLFPQFERVAAGDPPAASTLLDAHGPVKTSRAKRLAGRPIQIMVRVDLDALLRGVPLAGELCEIAGYGPVPVSVIEDLLATQNPFIVGILTQAQALVGVYHHGRRPNAHQKSALDFLYPTCAVEGCGARAGLQYDHRADFAQTKITAFDLLDRLCPHHHRQKTNRGWGLVEGRGKRAFVPPSDPRHPRHAGAPPQDPGHPHAGASPPARAP